MHGAFYFDLDGTLTKSRAIILGAHACLLQVLTQQKPVIVVSGATHEQIKLQLPLPHIAHLAQSGNDAYGKSGMALWQNRLSPDETTAIVDHIHAIAHKARADVNAHTLHHRGGQISFSFVNHNADESARQMIDPDGTLRARALLETPFQVPGLCVKIGGALCLDYTRESGTKGKNVARHIEMFGYQNPVYFGDALFPGGNDETVNGVCRTIAVENHFHTFKIIHETLLCMAKK